MPAKKANARGPRRKKQAASPATTGLVAGPYWWSSSRSIPAFDGLGTAALRKAAMGVQKLPRRHFGIAIQTSPKAAVPKPFLESLTYFEANEAALCEAVLTAVRRHYTHMRKTLRGLVSKDEFSRIAPAVQSLDDLAPLIAFAGLEVHAADRRGADLGFRFEVAWEEEHGLGVRVRGAEVVLIGDDDAAACDWTKAAATIKNFGDGLGG